MAGLRMEGVRHAYGRATVIHDVSLTVEEGEILCLVGPSGCGKTTTLRLAAGLEELQQGHITIGDRLVADGKASLPPERRGVGLVFQDYALFPHLTVLQNVVFGIPSSRTPSRHVRAIEKLEQVRMAGYAHAYPHTLSGGQQQRVALARALAPEPNLMLMDEPFSNLDVRLREEVCRDTFAVLKEANTSTLLVTHDPNQAMRMADRIAIMRAGRILQVAPPNELYTRPQELFTAKFMSDVNEFEGVVKEEYVHSPFGPLAAGDLAEGTIVDVAIRPEGLRLGPPGEGANGPTGQSEAVAAHVVATRLLGPYSLVELRLLASDEALLTSRIAGLNAPLAGDLVSVTLERSQSFVFARRGSVADE